MEKTVIDYLKRSADLFPKKIAFGDENGEICYDQLLCEVSRLATEIVNLEIGIKNPIAIFLDKGIQCIEAFCAVVYSGNFYTLLDTEMPEGRISKIVDTMDPIVYITDTSHYETVKNFAGEKIIINIDKTDSEINDDKLNNIYKRVMASDVMYVLFTSGSTGMPKGVVTPHRAVIRYIEALSNAYEIDSKTIMANQVPFYFVMSIVDIFATMRAGGTMYVVPKSYFTFVKYLVRFLEEKTINFISWVPSALCTISARNAFEKADLSKIKTVIFGGEVMPIKQLNLWRKALPDAAYINGYGPTEVTDGCTYYKVDRPFQENEILPIGVPFDNSEILVLNEENKLVGEGESGELCVRSDSMTYGYYGDFGKTNEVFVQNPLNTKYHEIIYRTGDLVCYDAEGKLKYLGRKDFQIKHMGRRIELGEIEANISSIVGVNENCCLYDSNNKQIVLFYAGEISEDILAERIRELLPTYMIPAKKYKYNRLPRNVNGKIDRNQLKMEMEERTQL